LIFSLNINFSLAELLAAIFWLVFPSLVIAFAYHKKKRKEI